jgi:hypothetical protein
LKFNVDETEHVNGLIEVKPRFQQDANPAMSIAFRGGDGGPAEPILEPFTYT